MTQQTKMHEPVAYRSKDQPYLFGLSTPTGNSEQWDGLITTTQAEAYANARVREALEQAAQICDDEAREWDSDCVITEKSYAECCAKRIRALIPATKKPMSPYGLTSRYSGHPCPAVGS